MSLKRDCLEKTGFDVNGIYARNPKLYYQIIEAMDLYAKLSGNLEREALEYLVKTKDRKDTIGKDSIYLQMQKIAWRKAREALKNTSKDD